MPAVPPAANDTHAPLPRADGEASRARLMLAGLRLFAEQGYARTSTRELAQAAEVNIAAIRYYFGDKAGLYRAVFFEPLNTVEEDLAMFNQPGLSLEGTLQGFFQAMLDPLCDGDEGRWCIKLRMREMLEPTSLWAEEIRTGIAPMHHLLVGALCRHLGLAQPDDDVHRLAIGISGMAMHLHVGRDVIDHVAPHLNQTTDAVPHWAAWLLRTALGMVEAERLHRLSRLDRPPRP